MKSIRHRAIEKSKKRIIQRFIWKYNLDFSANDILDFKMDSETSYSVILKAPLEYISITGKLEL